MKQAPLELCNLVGQGVPMAEAKARLGIVDTEDEASDEAVVIGDKPKTPKPPKPPKAGTPPVTPPVVTPPATDPQGPPPVDNPPAPAATSDKPAWMP